MKLRKLLSLFLIVALLVGLTACTAEVNVNTDVEIRLPDNLMTTATETESTQATTTIRYKTQGTALPTTTAPPTTVTKAPVTTTSRPIQKTSVAITTTTTTTVATTTKPTLPPIDENGIFDSKEDVALYIHTYGKLPQNYVTKSRYNKERDLCVGGDRFYNKEGLLPGGEIYYECDIDTYGITSRGAKRLVWTKSGIVYYTGDHYASFIQLYGER